MKIDKKELEGLNNNEFRISLMFILANGLHMQKHFTFVGTASGITGTEANPERISVRGRRPQNH